MFVQLFTSTYYTHVCMYRVCNVCIHKNYMYLNPVFHINHKLHHTHLRAKLFKHSLM